uniref:Uncharacterized protein n=1 Tax=Rhizophora mucronata TaxID=61149 RepID=A0A2P2LWY9_RHIMU
MTLIKLETESAGQKCTRNACRGSLLKLRSPIISFNPNSDIYNAIVSYRLHGMM